MATTLKGFDSLADALANSVGQKVKVRVPKIDFTQDSQIVPEGRVKQAVKERLDAIGAYHHWPVQNGMGAPCLDCHGCYNGHYFAIECKRPGKKPTSRQEATMVQIRTAGGWTFVIDNEEAARRLFL